MPKSRKGIPNKVTAAAKAETQSFFKRIIDDEKEAEMWQHFLMGTETNIICWQAFKRAVEYKRGMPKETVEHSGAIDITSVIEKARKRATGSAD